MIDVVDHLRIEYTPVGYGLWRVCIDGVPEFDVTMRNEWEAATLADQLTDRYLDPAAKA